MSEEQKYVVKLTPKDIQVLDLVCEGKTNAEIGEALGVSGATIRWRLHVIFQKMGAKTKAHAIAMYLQPGGIK